MRGIKRLGAFCLLLATAAAAGAAGIEHVKYAGGTAKLEQGVLGRLDTAQSSLVFESGGNKLEIPYAQIDSYGFSEEVAHHLGVLPAIAVVLVRKRERKHFLRIVYHDEQNVTQVAIFEIPKRAPQNLQAILQAMAPQRCMAPAFRACKYVR